MKQENQDSKQKRYIRKNMQKKLCVSVMMLILCLTCTGCVDYELIHNLLQAAKHEATDEPYVSYEEKTYNAAVDEFFAAVDAGDKAAIKEMFSEYVQEEVPDLDEKIDELLEFYPGPTDGCGRDGGSVHGRYSNDYGVHTSSVDDMFPVLSNGTYYWCRFELMYENDEDEDQIGITSVIFFSDDDYCDLRYDEDHSRKIPEDIGLHVYNECSLDCEIRSIGGYPYQYTSVDRVLDEEEVKKFLQESNCYTDFVDHFGEPNAINIFYCYELPDEDGQPRYLELGVYEEKDQVYSAAVYDDFEWLYLVYKADEE